MPYHINNAGKIYPCNAKQGNCPYGADRHAESRNELFHKIATEENSVKPSKGLQNEMQVFGRFTNLEAMSAELERTDMPVQMLVTSLGKAKSEMMENIANAKPEKTPVWVTEYEEEMNELLALQCYEFEHEEFGNTCEHIQAYNEYITDDMVVTAQQLAYKYRIEKKEGFTEHAGEDTSTLEQIGRLKDVTLLYRRWQNQKKSTNPKDMEPFIKYTEHEFIKYSKALNASKLVSQNPLNSPKETEELTRNLPNMTNEQLAELYDDYVIGDREIDSVLKEVNNFKYTPRKDISKKANKNIEKWYKHNEKLAKKYRLSSSSRIMFSINLQKEMEKRDLL